MKDNIFSTTKQINYRTEQIGYNAKSL